MQVGKLRHKVELKHLSQTQNTYGEPVDTWTKYADVWASIEPLSGRELLLAQQVNAELTLRVIIRYHSAMVVTDRIIKDSRTLEVVNIINKNERNEQMELLCKEVVAG